MSQSLQQRIPRKRRALHPHGIRAHAPERLEIAEIRTVIATLQHGAKMLGELLGRLCVQAVDGFAQHAGGRLADGAAVADEADRLDTAVAHTQRQIDLITTQRIACLDRAISRFHAFPVARVAIVVKDDLAIQIVVDRRESNAHKLILAVRQIG